MKLNKPHSNQKGTLRENYFLTIKPSLPSINSFIIIVSSLIIAGVTIMLIFRNISLVFPLVASVSIILYRVILYPYQVKKQNFEAKPSDAEINKWLIADLKTKIQEKAIKYLKLEADNITDDQFIIIPYPVFHSTQKIEDEKLHRIQTDDGYYNYSFWNIQVLILGVDYLSYYFCSYNSLNCEILNEKSNEFFYDDIAIVRNDIDQVDFTSKWNDGKLNEAHILKLVNISGDFLYLITELPELRLLPITLIDQQRVVQVLRVILRQIRKAKKADSGHVLQTSSETKQVETELQLTE
ncbi:MAG: hypothetical protein B6I20_05665 [Bacteroidetes bacterium 4572_117]|nr:MAG: hypothetical protein B6I20_05665 [Bacteroidetes bacterium 4572_117]